MEWQADEGEQPGDQPAEVEVKEEEDQQMKEEDVQEVKHEDQPEVQPEEMQPEELKLEEVKPEEDQHATEPAGEQGQDGEEVPEQPVKRRRNKFSALSDPEPASLPEGLPLMPVGDLEQGEGSALPGPPPMPPQRKHRWGAPMEAAVQGGEKKRKKRSRWEDAEEPATQAIVIAAPPGTLLGKFSFPRDVTLSNGTLVTLPSSLIGDAHSDPRIRGLHDQLKELDRKIERNEVDIPPEGQRSPSPEPVYDRMGVRLNTREIRHKEKLIDQRLATVEELIKSDPMYKPPADYRPRKFTAKVRIPQDEFPSYNFIGLLIGPRGNTQKRMQQETNTKIAIRGRGSVKEGANKDPKYDHGEDEELHVMVTGNTQQDVDRAVAMVELLCRPDDDSLSEHKRLQLRELAALNGTLKDEQACPVCGELTHRGYECPQAKLEMYVLPDAIKEKVEEQYKRDVARVRGADAVASEDDYKTFLKEMGGQAPPELMGGLINRAGLGSMPTRGRDLPDDCKLYVGSLPMSFTDDQLKGLFEAFGTVSYAGVVQDQATGASRQFGFVHFDDAQTARTAASTMNNKPLDGRPLVVRVRTDTPERGAPRGPTGPTNFDNVNTIYVTALNPTVTEGTLREVFSAYGRVSECRLITDRATGMSKGYAFITMATPDELNAAMAGADGYKLDGRGIVVRRAGQKSDGPPPRGGPGGGAPFSPPFMGGGGPGGGGLGPPEREGRIFTPNGPRDGPPPPHWGPPPPHAFPPPGHAGYPPPGPYGYGAPPPYGMPPPGLYGAPPPYGGYGPGPYGPPPPGPYGVPYGAPPPYGYGQPPLPGGMPPPGPYGAPPPPQPPLPSDPVAQPPLPASGPGGGPSAPQSDYERFMADLQKQFS